MLFGYKFLNFLILKKYKSKFLYYKLFQKKFYNLFINKKL